MALKRKVVLCTWEKPFLADPAWKSLFFFFVCKKERCNDFTLVRINLNIMIYVIELIQDVVESALGYG